MPSTNGVNSAPQSVEARHLRYFVVAAEAGTLTRAAEQVSIAQPTLSEQIDYRHGGQDQIWIAGGIGITPFMSWIRSVEATFDRRVDFYYSVAREADALYLDEIDAAGAHYHAIHPHIVYTD